MTKTKTTTKTKAAKTKTSPAPKRTKARELPPRAEERPPSASSGQTIKQVLLGDIQPDPGQPRKVSPLTDLSDITSSIAVGPDGEALPRRGIRDAINIRKTPPHLPQEIPWTILKGERRWRAAGLVGLKRIPAIIVEIAEADVLAEQLLENVARADLSPLEISDAIELLGAKLSADEIAQRVGLSSGRAVHRYRALARLAPEVRAELAEGKLERLGVALALATLEDHKLQVEALPRVRELDARSARRFIEGHYHLRLVRDACGFDPADASLPGGSCETCPKNTKTQRGLWADVESEDGRCTDRECFAGKKTETAQRKIDAAEAAGAKVLSEEEAKQILPTEWSDPRAAGYIDLDAWPDRGKDETWRDLLGAGVAPAAVTKDRDGRVRELVPVSEAAAQLRAQGLDDVAQGLEEAEEPEEAPAPKERVPRKALEAAEEEATTHILGAVRRRDGLSFWCFCCTLALRSEQELTDDNYLEPLLHRRGLEVPKDGSSVEALLRWLASPDLSEGDCRALLVEMMVSRIGYRRDANHDTDPFMLACRFAGVDFETLLQKHRAAKPKGKGA